MDGVELIFEIGTAKLTMLLAPTWLSLILMATLPLLVSGLQTLLVSGVPLLTPLPAIANKSIDFVPCFRLAESCSLLLSTVELTG